jgi:hypothetical protein
VIDSENSIVIEQANNRTYAQLVLQKNIEWKIKNRMAIKIGGNIIDNQRNYHSFI